MPHTRKKSALWSDPLLLIISIILSVLGLLMIYSATHNLALDHFNDSYYYLRGHLKSLIMGIAALYFGAKISLNWLRDYSSWILLFTILLLMMVIFGFGAKAGGATRWLKIAGHRFGQPSEFAKITVILYLSHSLSRKQDRIDKFFVGYVPHVITVGFVVMLLMVQPDFGTSMMILTITAFLLFLGRVPVKYLLGSGLLALPMVYLMLILSPYRWARIKSFLDPFAKENIQNGAYQLVQSLKAFASGGMWGMGLGHGKQKLGYLPEAHTDFIFAVVGEELGLIGVFIIMILLLFLLYRGFRISLRASTFFQKLFAFGLTSMIGVQSLLNMGVVMGALPTKGMPLPFISFARSSLIVVLLAIGILLQIERKTLDLYQLTLNSKLKNQSKKQPPSEESSSQINDTLPDPS